MPSFKKSWLLYMHTTARHAFHCQTIAVLKVTWATFAVASEACQKCMGTWVVLKWLHLPWKGIWPAVNHHTTGW